MPHGLHVKQIPHKDICSTSILLPSLLYELLLIEKSFWVNIYQGHKDIARKSSMPPMKSSRQPVDYSESEKEESEYETEEEEYEGSPAHRREEDVEQDYEEEEEEANEDSEEEAEVSGSS